MKINQHILSIPPYISTTWSNVSSLHVQDDILFVGLLDGESIGIPNLSPKEVTEIFTQHTKCMEADARDPSAGAIGMPIEKLLSQFPIGGTGGSVRFDIEGMEGMTSIMDHNPAQANAPDLPQEMIQKIAAIAQVVAPNEVEEMPRAEPHCNCFHCQVARAMHHTITHSPDFALPLEEEVSNEELTFREWDIEEVGSQLFKVTNRRDTSQQYTVHLGSPMGCTCGKEGCDHLLAVLRT